MSSARSPSRTTPGTDRSVLRHRSVSEVLDELGVDLEHGLDGREVRERRRRYGPNRLRESSRRGAWDVLVDQFKSLIVILLLVAAGVSAAFGQFLEAAAIGAALVVDAVVGFVTEMRALRSMDALRRIEQTTARVRRDGDIDEVPARDLVPGDVVLLDEGAVVPADLRLVEAVDLRIDEAALTGESVAVAKSTEPVEEGTPLAEQSCMAFKGTAVRRGTAAGVVAATGMDTEIGHISKLVEEAETDVTPLERRLDRLGRRLVFVTIGMAALVAISGVLTGRDLLLVVETAIVLGVAAVPEGLPIVASLALARGVHRMADRNALVKRLSSVETLGSAGIIMTDKTGTLTEGRMRLVSLADAEGRVELDAGDGRAGSELDDRFRTVLEVAALCTDADPEQGTGDPMELAILDAARVAGAGRRELERQRPRVAVDPFDRDTKMMATFHRAQDGDVLVAVKGAPEAVIDFAARVAAGGDGELDDRTREAWRQRNRELASDGQRVLAVACGRRSEADEDAPYHDLTLLGLLGLVDPPRTAAVDAIDECRDAGIRVIMVTGDQPATAGAIATQVGVAGPDPEVVSGEDIDDPDEAPTDEREHLRQVDVFARVSPEDKLDLIALHQNAGAVVAMTGDGVNDAPALEKADIGVAMGQRGTQVAQDAADIILLDDAFDTIVTAVCYGRTVFTNIRKFVVYLLSGNLAEILAVTAATVSGLPLPLLPLQILYINFVADIFPALALGLSPASSDVMADPPRDPDEPILTRSLWGEVGTWGVLIAVTVLGGLLAALWMLDVPREEAAGVSFLTFGFARVWHTFNMRRPGSGLLVNEITTNRYVWIAVGIGIGLMALAAWAPPVSRVLDVRTPGGAGWAVILAGSLTPLVIGQVARSLPLGRTAVGPTASGAVAGEADHERKGRVRE